MFLLTMRSGLRRGEVLALKWDDVDLASRWKGGCAALRLAGARWSDEDEPRSGGATPMKVIQEYLGHTTIQMTMRYAHLCTRVGKQAIRLLDTPADEQADGTGGGSKTQNP